MLVGLSTTQLVIGIVKMSGNVNLEKFLHDCNYNEAYIFFCNLQNCFFFFFFDPEKGALYSLIIQRFACFFIVHSLQLINCVEMVVRMRMMLGCYGAAAALIPWLNTQSQA